MTESCALGSVGSWPPTVRSGLRHLQRDGVHVRGLRPVDAGRRGARDQVQVLEGPQRAEVEDAAQVDVETLPR